MKEGMSAKTVCQHLTTPLGVSEEGWVLPNLMGKRSVMASLIVILSRVYVDRVYYAPRCFRGMLGAS